jgi:hypothetical protein
VGGDEVEQGGAGVGRVCCHGLGFDCRCCGCSGVTRVLVWSEWAAGSLVRGIFMNDLGLTLLIHQGIVLQCLDSNCLLCAW